MERRTAFFGMAAAVVLLTFAAFLTGCGTTSISGTVAVIDSGNQRVLLFNSPFRTDDSASVVLGKPDFTHNLDNGSSVPGASNLNSPTAVAFDMQGNAFIADGDDCRVLEFQAPLASGMSASIVIGQPDATTVNCLTGTLATASGMGAPTSVALDKSGNFWVADGSNSRVLEFVPPFSNGMAATLALGQTSTGAAGFFPCDQGIPLVPSASTLCGPTSLTFDANGNLWVTDSGNSRVLEFVPPFSTGMAASMELGQPPATAFTTSAFNNGGISATSLAHPLSAVFDSSGNLWVSDSGNQRVLEYVLPLSNGKAATVVIGQRDFVSSSVNQGAQGGFPPSRSSLWNPSGLAFDSSGNLIVADTGNSRVLRFSPSFHSGMNAAAVLGQPNFTAWQSNQNHLSPAANTLSGPGGVASF